MKNEKLKIISVFLLLILLVSCGVDVFRNQVIREDIKGVVIKKDTSFNHAAHVLKYADSTGEEKELYVGRWEKHTDLWSYVQSGDSIIKPPSSLLLLVKSKGEYVKIYHSQY